MAYLLMGAPCLSRGLWSMQWVTNWTKTGRFKKKERKKKERKKETKGGGGGGGRERERELAKMEIIT